MDEQDFEGTDVLEKLACIGKVDEFFEAIDSDNLRVVATLMRQARVDSKSIAIVLKMIAESDGEH